MAYLYPSLLTVLPCLIFWPSSRHNATYMEYTRKPSRAKCCVQVLDRLNPALRPLVTHVHDLFFKPVDTDWGLMYIYQDNVPWEELKKALRRGYAWSLLRT